MPTVSVIVPVYKVEKYLHRCVDSILAQTFTDFELLLVDDGSPDKCGTICDEYAAMDARVRVFHQKNQGVSVARNRALESAVGEFITFIDSDDWLAENYLQALYTNLMESDADICVSAIQRITEEGELLPRKEADRTVYYGREIIEHFGREDGDVFRCPLSKLVRAAICKQVPFPKGRVFAEDFAVIYQWYGLAEKAVEIGDPIYYYLERTGSAVHSEYSLKRMGTAESMEELLAYLQAKGYEGLFDRFLHTYLWELAYHVKSIREELGDKKTARETRNKLRRVIRENKGHVSRTEDSAGFNEAFPVRMWFYWTLLGIAGKLRNRKTKLSRADEADN